jgi:hypothetical protein
MHMTEPCCLLKSDGDASDDEIECDGLTEYIQTAQRGSNLKEMNIRSFVSSFLINSNNKKPLEPTESPLPKTTAKIHNLNDGLDAVLPKDTNEASQLINSAANFSAALGLTLQPRQAKKLDDRRSTTLVPSCTMSYALAPIVTPVLHATASRHMVNARLMPKSAAKPHANHRNSYPLPKTDPKRADPKYPATQSSTNVTSSVSFYSTSQLKMDKGKTPTPQDRRH